MSNNPLEHYTDEELKAELDQRQAPPDPLASEDVNISELAKQASEYIEDVQRDGCPSKDAEHFIFESVMETFYGKDVWNWLNKRHMGI
jgi:hypothetical protein